jgi:pimeloyl-ACP methyl ester carboxylesterase
VRVLERPDGAKIHVEFFGREDAPPIVLTHGFSNDSTTWYYLKRLQEEFRLIVWDLRGVGFSEGSRDQNYALEAMAGDLRAVLDLAGPDRRPLLVGHSMGGMIALTLLRDAAQRERIAGLVLLNTTYTNPTRTCSLRSLATALQKPVLEPVLWLNNFVWPLTWLANWSSYSNGTAHLQTRISAFAGNQTRGQVEHSTRMSVECSPKVLARQALGMLRYEARDVLPQVDLPALVITAPKDTATEPDASEFLQRTLPKAKLVTVEGAAHASMDEQGPAVCAIVSSFAAETFASLPPRTNFQEPIIQGTL